MKTSFYFVLWILIYFVLLPCRVEFITHNAVIGVSIIVLVIYWLISCNGSSQESLLYERKLQRAKKIEENGHISNSYKSIIVRILCIFIIVIYIFSVTALAWILNRIHTRDNDWWIQTDWIGFFIYALFTFRIFFKQIALSEFLIHSENSSKTDESHITEYRNHVMASRPKLFKLYQALNLLSSLLATIFGIIFVGVSCYFFFGPAVTYEEKCVGLACIFYMYGSLAAFFGVKDFISVIHSESNLKSVLKA